MGQANQVDQALAPSYLGKWTLTGPTKSGAFTVTQGDRWVGTIKPGDLPAEEFAEVARLMSRSAVRLTMLQHILAELEGDDEGTRWGDLLRMIRDELQVTP